MLGDHDYMWAWRFVVALTPDGWDVMCFTNGDETEEEVLERGKDIASNLGADSRTARLVHLDKATDEERAIFENWTAVVSARLARRRRARLAAAEGIEPDNDAS